VRQRAVVDDLEVATGQLIELMQRGVIPARVGAPEMNRGEPLSARIIRSA